MIDDMVFGTPNDCKHDVETMSLPGDNKTTWCFQCGAVSWTEGIWHHPWRGSNPPLPHSAGPDTSYAMAMERYLIGTEDWAKHSNKPGVPPQVQEVIDDAEPQGLGIGVHPKHGWFVLGCGQGPHVIWLERP